jgi:signal transduction histidine kinase
MTLTPSDLRPLDLFDDLDDGGLEPWVAIAHEQVLQPGEIIAEHGEPPPGVVLLLDGIARTLILQAGHTQTVGRQAAPTWALAIAVLTGGPSPIRMEAETPCRLALIEPDDFRRLALATPPVHQRVMRQVAPVMTRVSAMEQNRERLASLGTMAAGLAHELNNPAAAARRAAADMAEALEVLSSTIGRFVHSGIERADAAELVALQKQALESAKAQTALSALEAADAEDALNERLDELGVQEPWRLAEPLAAAGVDEEWIARIAERAGPATDAALRWVAASLTARGLAAELQESTERMSSLVAAVKSYAYMDRGELVEVDLHEGLETTLTVLGHKLKHAAITVRRDYDKTLPRITVNGSELNQVWTNLLDNAIDAVGEQGTITVSTRRDGDCALIDIGDDGPGIAPEIRDHIFDSFFTTKEVGSGTGLGLATARRIVVDRHNGSLTVDSQPGQTTFHVWLPYS